MHDIGKIGVPDAVLLKPAPLAADEWEIMKSHAVIGAELLSGDDSSLLVLAREIALTHHEKWDGSGYPHGLAGTAIPQSGRIVAVTDVFDALTSARPYKHAWPVETAVAYLSDNRGTHFDPAVVDAFLAQLDTILAIRNSYLDPAED
jgi:putative two-component system response regulator